MPATSSPQAPEQHDDGFPTQAALWEMLLPTRLGWIMQAEQMYQAGCMPCERYEEISATAVSQSEHKTAQRIQDFIHRHQGCREARVTERIVWIIFLVISIITGFFV